MRFLYSLRLLLIFFLVLSCSPKKLLLKEKNESENLLELQGKIVWKKQLKSAPATNPIIGYGYLFLPLSDKRLIIFEPEECKTIRSIYTDFNINSVSLGNEMLYMTGIGEWNAILCINLRTLEKIFEKSADPAGGKILYNCAGLLFLTNRGKLFLIDALAGNKKAEQNLNILPTGFSTNGDLLVVLGADGSVVLVHPEDLNVKRKTTVAKKLETAPFFEDNIIFGALDGTLFSLDTALTPLFTVSLNGKIIAPPICRKGFIFVITKEGNLFKLDKNTGDIVSSIELDAPFVCSPFAFGESIIVCDLSGMLYIIDEKDLTTKKKIKLNGMIKQPPTAYKGKIYVLTESGYLYCID